MVTQAPSGPQALAGVQGSGAATIAPDPPEREPSPPPPAVPSPAREPAAGPAAGDGALPNPRRALELIGLVVAPTTLVTALAFYFGWVLTNSRASYFGIDASALGYSTQDYLLRSADALFVPLGSVFVLALGCVWLHAFALRQLREPATRARVRIAALAAVAVGSVLFALGVFAVFRPLSFSPHYLFRSASPGVGIALLAYGLHLLDRIGAAQRGQARGTETAASVRATALALVAMLVVLSGFWTASQYADALGRGRAQRLAASLHLRPQVTVYAPKGLAIDSAGVVEERLAGDDGAYRYRYSGLRLLVRSGGKYFLVPDSWTRRSGTAIVLADSPDYRFEFGSGR
jgi:hypothetical protein